MQQWRAQRAISWQSVSPGPTQNKVRVRIEMDLLREMRLKSWLNCPRPHDWPTRYWPRLSVPSSPPPLLKQYLLHLHWHCVYSILYDYKQRDTSHCLELHQYWPRLFIPSSPSPLLKHLLHLHWHCVYNTLPMFTALSLRLRVGRRLVSVNGKQSPPQFSPSTTKQPLTVVTLVKA